MNDARTTHYPIIIAGAGLAGLSACYHLLQQGVDAPILLLDGRTRYDDDRTWCYWAVEPTPFDHLATHSWDQWTVRSPAGSQHQQSDRHPYLHLPSASFYDYVKTHIAQHPNVSVHLGEAVTDIVADQPQGRAMAGRSVTVGTARTSYTADVLIDTRGLSRQDPLARQAQAESVWLPQHFVGLRVRANQPSFDPATAVLMDFDVDQSAGLHFVYVLPTSPTEALVENVYLADSAVGAGQHRAEIADYLHQRYGLAKDEWTITGQEAGFIPMTDFVFPTRSGERIFTLGTRGGQTRAASGYTFVRVQRQAQQLAAHIAGDLASSGLANLRPGPGDATPARFHTLDGIFLAYLTRFPQAGPDLFARLAGAVDGDTFARFMTEATTPKEELDIVLSLPILPFVGVAGRRLLDSTIKRLRKKMAPSAGQSTPRAKSAPGRTLAPAPALAQPFRKGPHVH